MRTAVALAAIIGFLLIAPGSKSYGQNSSFEIPETDEGLPGSGPIRRHSWFQRVWKQRRTHFADSAKADQGAVVFLGDSITQGWGDDFGGRFDGLKTANRGISGDTTRGMLVRLEEDVLSINPACVVMLMGTNDLDENASPQTIADNILLIIQKLHQHNADMPVVLCNVFPSSPTLNRPAEKIRRINQLCAADLKNDPAVTFIDTFTLFADSKGNAKKEEFPDLLHPNKVGYDKWALALKPIFATLELIETTPDSWQPDDGFVSLFNGQDLTGWSFLPTTEAMLKTRARWKNAPPWPIVKEAVAFDGRKATPDSRFQAINGRLVVTTPSEGRRIQQLWTTQPYNDDFTLKLEFRATPHADSGIFIRGKQLQCRDFVLAGPYKDLKKYRPQQWNRITIKVTGTSARCTCNGEVLEEALDVPEAGHIGLEGDRGQVEYRHLQIHMQ